VINLETKPKSLGVDSAKDSQFLAHGRYGTDDMIKIWGAEKTFQYILDSQATAVKVMSDLYPDIVPTEDAEEICNKAVIGKIIDPNRIRELEEKTGHDVIAINTALGEVVSKGREHINKARTSADSTETAKALQLKQSLEIIIDSLENLRDITIEKATSDEFIQPFMDTTHLYDALPTLAGRPLIFYTEMLQSDLNLLAFFYKNSIYGKWADATGNHHQAKDLEIDGIELQEKYCKSFGIKNMIANAQIPGREFIADIAYGMARTAETIGNLAFYIALGKSDDWGVFIDTNPKKRKGSSAMPHKDAKGGNPTTEEQTESFTNYMRGVMSCALSSCKFKYGRDLSGSASDRINLEDMFKFGDHVIRRLASTVYYLGLNKERSVERVKRSDFVTAQRIMTSLTDIRFLENPMSRKEAHDLTGELATSSYNQNLPFRDVCLQCKEITNRIYEEKIIELTDPLTYIGQSEEIISLVKKNYYKQRTLSP